MVVAIIAILAALLLPALRKARAGAQAIGCVSNLRQIGVGLTMYRNDADGFFPPMYQPFTDGGGTYTRPFPFRLVPYVGGTYRTDPGNGRVSCGLDPARVGHHLFYCPAEDVYTRSDYQFPLVDFAWLYGPSWDFTISTYSMLSGLGYHHNMTEATQPWLRPKRGLVHPSRTLVYVDGRREPRCDHSFRFVRFRHPGGANTLMGDMHVQRRNEDAMAEKWTDRVFHLYDPSQYRYSY